VAGSLVVEFADSGGHGEGYDCAGAVLRADAPGVWVAGESLLTGERGVGYGCGGLCVGNGGEGQEAEE